MDEECSAEFERLLSANLPMLKRYLFHKISNAADAEDIFQHVLMSAFESFDSLRNHELFKSWLLGIASHKCADYYKAQAKRL